MVDEIVPADARRILDLGTGDGRLVAILRRSRPNAEYVAIDVSPPMLEAARGPLRRRATRRGARA